MKVVDTRGKKCPVPIIETRKALKETESGEAFAVITDNLTSYNNISRFLSDNKIEYTVTESGGEWRFTVRASAPGTALSEAEVYCDLPLTTATPGYSVAITSEFMGSGDDVLGKKLMKSFFIGLSCLDSMPAAIVFYNSGVKLAAEGSEVTDILKELEAKGVKLILCGTCTDYYGITGSTVAGTIGDMYLILQTLADSSKVIRP
jgi:selenium metabolism protein YedF